METGGMIVRTTNGGNGSALRRGVPAPVTLLAIIFAVLAVLVAILALADAAASFAAGTAFLVDLKRPPDDSPVTVLTVIGGGEPLEWGGTRLAGGDINGDGIADLVI